MFVRMNSIFIFSVSLFACHSLLADMAFLPAVRDNTLFESTTGALSNGAGDFLFAGRTNVLQLRRGLIQFDVSSIPAGATINSATLRLTMNRSVLADAGNVSIHRVTNSWGEGTSNAPGQEGAGTASAAGDATWIHRSFSDVLWTNAGGDFSATASATQLLNADGTYTWSGPGLVADIRDWITNPSSNSGWLLRADESVAAQVNAMRFVSRTGPGGANVQPLLTVDFTAVPEPSCIAMLSSLALIGFVARRRVLAKAKQ
jgi:hypothetical protein